MLRKHAAQLKAQGVLKQTNQLRPPIDLYRVADFLEVHVEERALDDSLSGLAFIKEGRRFIVVNEAHVETRKRFTLAHELAHHALHTPMLEGGVHVDKRVLRRDQASATGYDLVEIEANNFAAELLMPTQWIEKLTGEDFDLGDDHAVQSLAKTFRVSSSALYFRVLAGPSKPTK
ncbi:MAG: ImmA/IrrE family metallo-endopeptidase [Pseudomonadota bacterium]